MSFSVHSQSDQRLKMISVIQFFVFVFVFVFVCVCVGVCVCVCDRCGTTVPPAGYLRMRRPTSWVWEQRWLSGDCSSTLQEPTKAVCVCVCVRESVCLWVCLSTC